MRVLRTKNKEPSGKIILCCILYQFLTISIRWILLEDSINTELGRCDDLSSRSQPVMSSNKQPQNYRSPSLSEHYLQYYFGQGVQEGNIGIITLMRKRGQYYKHMQKLSHQQEPDKLKVVEPFMMIFFFFHPCTGDEMRLLLYDVFIQWVKRTVEFMVYCRLRL